MTIQAKFDRMARLRVCYLRAAQVSKRRPDVKERFKAFYMGYYRALKTAKEQFSV